MVDRDVRILRFTPFHPSMSVSLPYDVWFNGDVAQQIEAGTYKECRPVFVEWVAKGKIAQAQLDSYDKHAGEKPAKKKVK